MEAERKDNQEFNHRQVDQPSQGATHIRCYRKSDEWAISLASN
jgi:hypothetical protein